jgi:uncharacterized membrane protein
MRLGDRLSSQLINIGINPYIVVLIIAILPIIELRGAIPTGILFLHLNPVLVVLISIIGNMLPIFFILFLFKFFEKLLRKIKIFDKFFDWLFKRTLAKSKDIEQYQELGLMIFVAIPLPMTGAWTGALAAYLLNLSYIKSLVYIFFGVLIASAIVSVFTLILTNFTLIWQIIITILFIILIVVISIILSFIAKKTKK